MEGRSRERERERESTTWALSLQKHLAPITVQMDHCANRKQEQRVDNKSNGTLLTYSITVIRFGCGGVWGDQELKGGREVGGGGRRGIGRGILVEILVEVKLDYHLNYILHLDESFWIQLKLR